MLGFHTLFNSRGKITVRKVIFKLQDLFPQLGQSIKAAPPPPVPFLHLPVLPSGPVSRPVFIQAVIKEEEEGVTGLYTPHSWKLMGLFTTQCRVYEKMRSSEPGDPFIPCAQS